MRQAENLGDVVSVDEVVNKDAARHREKPTPVTRRHPHL
jgi:hypothetical protein